MQISPRGCRSISGTSEWLWSVLIDWDCRQDLGAYHSRPQHHNRPMGRQELRSAVLRAHVVGLGRITAARVEFVSQPPDEVLTLPLRSAGIRPCRSLWQETSVNTCNALQEQNRGVHQAGVSYLCQYASPCVEEQGGWHEGSKKGGLGGWLSDISWEDGSILWSLFRH